MATSDTDDSDDEVPTHLVTAPVMLLTGLRLVGYTEERIRRAKDETNRNANFSQTSPYHYET